MASWKVALLLFGSGLCALVYQTAWLRELRLVFGVSTAASAAVLAIFMGGLGAGGLILGRRTDRHPNPLAFYAKLEIAIALTAALTPGLVDLVRLAYIAVGGTPVLGITGGTLTRLLLSALVLLGPTFLMGGTFPAAARAVADERDAGRSRLALLYGANTIGAVTGVMLATFFLLEVFGTRKMLWSACLANSLVGLIALSLSRSATRRPSLPPATETPRSFATGDRNVHPALVLVAAAFVGFAFLLMEIVWYRMLGPILGGTLYTFGLILAVALLGIGVGGIACGAILRGREPNLYAFAVTCSLEALFLAVPLAAGDRIAVAAVLLRDLGAVGFLGHVLAWSAIAGFVVFPAAFIAGVQFPLLIGLLGRGQEGVGTHAGQAYAANTLGCIAGSLAGGFGILPALSATGTWRLVIGLLATLGGASVVLAARKGWSWIAGGALAASVAACLLMFTDGPTAAWRHSPIGAGRAKFPSPTPNGIRDWINIQRRSVAWETDGVESSVALTFHDGYAFLVNGKSDGNARGDAGTQVMGGLLGAILHPDPRSAMVVGLGTGSTAGWLGAVPSIEAVHVAELEPAILDVARACAAVNHHVLDNPKVQVFLGDAREFLLTTRERYDIVFSEPSNPYRAGIASLFTLEFYEAVRDRLNPGGIFLQWLQAYEVDSITVRTVYTTLTGVFPYVDTWLTKEGDLLLVATQQAIDYDASRLRERVGQTPFREAMFAVWRATDLEGLFAHFVARSSLALAFARVDEEFRNTDDLTLVEFGFARALGQRTLFDVEALRSLARSRGEDKPIVTGGDVDWERVAEERIASVVAHEDMPEVRGDDPEDRRIRTRALAAFHSGDLRRALHEWRSQPREPRNPVEVALVAEALAEAGDEAAMPHIENLRALEPTESDAILARLRVRQGRYAEATAAFEAAFLRYRTDPWPLRRIMKRVMPLTIEVARRDPSLGRRLYDALSEPFAVAVLNEERLNARAILSTVVDLEGLCAQAFEAFEPHIPWRLPFLAERARCYNTVGHPLAEQARADLKEYLSREPVPIDRGLASPGKTDHEPRPGMPIDPQPSQER